MVRISHIIEKVKLDIQIVNMGMYYTYMYIFTRHSVFKAYLFIYYTTFLLFQTMTIPHFCVNSQNNHIFATVHKLFSISGYDYGIIMLSVS